MISTKKKFTTTTKLKMKNLLFIIFLIAFCLSETSYAYELINPYAFQKQELIIENPIFDTYFLEQIINENKIPIIINGTIDFYIASDTDCFKKDGFFCSAIYCGNIICGSNKFEKNENYTTITNGLLIGNEELHNATLMTNKLRIATLNLSQDISEIENKIHSTKNQELENIYLKNRYDDSIKNIINEKIIQDTNFNEIIKQLQNKNITKAMPLIDDYFNNNYNISTIYDSDDLYTGIKNQQIGPTQYLEILDTILKENNINESLDFLINNSNILNSTFKKEAIEQILKELNKNPEFMDEVLKTINSNDSKLYDELISKIIDESLKDKELLNQLLETFPDLLNDPKMRDLFLKTASNAIRDMQKSGTLDKLMDTVYTPEVKNKIMSQTKQMMPSIIDSIVENIKSHTDQKYIFPIIGLFIIIIILTKMRF